MRYGFVRMMAVVGMMAAATGCGPHKQAARPSGPPMVAGRAVVVEVNARLGMATLDMHGKQIDVYWKPEIVVADNAHSEILPPKTIVDPYVGIAQEPTVVPTAFPGKPGDIVDFLGMRDGEDVYLSRIAVVGHQDQ